MKKVGIALVTLAVASLAVQGAQAENDEQRRAAISAKGLELFKNTKNHCRSYVDLVTFASGKAESAVQLVDDLKFVLIGTGLRERGKGSYYIGNKAPGIKGDTGFKAELRDNSPQVEHSWAAIYVGKFYPPGAAEAASLKTEVMGPLESGGKLNAADILLWTLGGDTGQRLDNSNFKQLASVISKTQCE